MADIHIADFYKDAARILVQLYNQFPRPTMLFVEDIAGPDTPDEFGLHSPRHQSCLSTMLWLAQSGYLSYETLVRQEAIDQAVLTQRGFTLLATPLPMHNIVGFDTFSDEDVPTLDNTEVAASAANGVQLLREVLKIGASTAIEQVMLELFRQSRHHP